jgi:hypothetical protein
VADERRSVTTRTGLQDTDAGGAWWAQGGALWRIGRTFNLGIDLRYSAAHLEFERQGFTQHVVLDGLCAGILTGWSWGGKQ